MGADFYGMNSLEQMSTMLCGLEILELDQAGNNQRE